MDSRKSRLRRLFHVLPVVLCVLSTYVGYSFGQTQTTGDGAVGVSRKKVILFGFDGLMPEEIDRYRKDVPEIDQFVSKGFFSPAIESPYTDTATNWNTIQTGTWVGTHGITGFEVHLPGMPLGETIGGEYIAGWPQELVKVDDLWHAAERQGKHVILINYPDAFPKLLDHGVVVGGKGLAAKDWTLRSGDYLSSFRKERGSKRLVLGRPIGWSNVPKSYKLLAEGVVLLDDQVHFGWSTIGMIDEKSVRDAAGEKRYFLTFKDGDTTKVLISASRDAAKPITVLTKGQWSGWVHENFAGKDGLRQYKALDLDPEGKEVTIYGTPVGVLSGWGYPKEIEQQVLDNAGAYIEGLELNGDQGVINGWFGWDTVLEIIGLQTEFLTKTAAYLNKTQPWDLMSVVIHVPDGINHLVIGNLESEDPAVRDKADWILREELRKIFQMASTIVRQIGDENTVVGIVSDHGNLPKTKWVNVHSIMIREGWTKFVKDEKTGLWNIDQAHSVAVYGPQGVWINLKGREKDGIIEPGKEYEALRTKIIQRLRQVADPVTGEDAYSIVGRREDMEGLGVWGDHVEDIFAFERPHYFAAASYKSYQVIVDVPEPMMNLYLDKRDVVPWADANKAGLLRELTAVHWGLPTSSAGFASNRATFVLSGKGVLEGKRLARVNLVDVAPTISHILGIHPPNDAEGRIIWQALTP
jgi:predicted AlkP superfamily phosphohydrolase/phosphomutase